MTKTPDAEGARAEIVGPIEPLSPDEWSTEILSTVNGPDDEG